MKNKILKRFAIPYGQVRNKKTEDYSDKLTGFAKRCFGTPEGQFVLNHLIEMTQLDDQIGCLPSDEANYLAGQQDIVKELLALQSAN